MRALHEQLLQGNTGRILEAITNAEALLGRQDIDFPRIAVFGDESTGKSSMLEAICKIPFPRGRQTVTRCPTLLRMQRKPGASWSASAWAGYDSLKRKNETHVHRREDVAAVIGELQSKLLKDEMTFSTEPVTVSLSSDDAVDLILVDLPGYFTNEGLDAATDSGDIDRVKESLLTYLKDENTIALVVVPANQLVKTVNIFNLLKEYEDTLSVAERVKLRARTIFCFTKCDLVGGGPGTQVAPHDIEEILSNKGPFAAEPHGWYAIVNTGGSNSSNGDFATRMTRDREYEDKFFAKHAPYNKRDLRPRCGTHNLVQKLSSLLTEKISEKIATMCSQTEAALAEAKRELKAIDPPSEIHSLSIKCRTIMQDIKEYYIQATEGNYGRLKDEIDDLHEDLPAGELEKCKLAFIRKQRCEAFAEQIKEARLPLEDEVYLRNLRNKVGEAVNGKFQSTMPIPEVLYEEVRICAKKWRGIAENLCNEIADAAIECLHVLVRVKASRYENLPARLSKYLTDMIEEQRMKALNRLSWHYVDEIVRPDTLNWLFDKEISAVKNLPGLGKDTDRNRDAYVCNLKAYLPIAEARYIDNAVRTVTTHILDVPRGSRMTRLESEDPPKYSFLAPQLYESENIKHLMRVRDEISSQPDNLKAKIGVLEELQDALQGMSAPPKPPKSPQTRSSRTEDAITLDAVQVRKIPTGESTEEAEMFESVSSEAPSFIERLTKIFTEARRLESRKHRNR